MKRIIDGKTYNTNTAELLAEASSNTPVSDFSSWTEGLYRSRKGTYFIAGEGGPMSGYAQSCGQNEWTGGEDLRVLSEAEARKWMETNATAAEYIEAFGEPEEG